MWSSYCCVCRREEWISILYARSGLRRGHVSFVLCYKNHDVESFISFSITMFTSPKAYLGCCLEDFDVSFELVDFFVCLLVCPVLFLCVITAVVVDLL